MLEQEIKVKSNFDKRLEYLMDYANRLQGFQSISDVHLHKEINEVVNEIRKELGLGQAGESDIMTEFHVHENDIMNVSITSPGIGSRPVKGYQGPLHVIIKAK